MTGEPIGTPGPFGNDVMVTVPSRSGTGTFDAKTTNIATLTGSSCSDHGRDHGTAADVGVAALTVAPWVIAVEQAKGDLK